MYQGYGGYGHPQQMPRASNDTSLAYYPPYNPPRPYGEEPLYNSGNIQQWIPTPPGSQAARIPNANRSGPLPWNERIPQSPINVEDYVPVNSTEGKAIIRPKTYVDLTEDDEPLVSFKYDEAEPVDAGILDRFDPAPQNAEEGVNSEHRMTDDDSPQAGRLQARSKIRHDGLNIKHEDFDEATNTHSKLEALASNKSNTTFNLDQRTSTTLPAEPTSTLHLIKSPPSKNDSLVEDTPMLAKTIRKSEMTRRTPSTRAKTKILVPTLDTEALVIPENYRLATAYIYAPIEPSDTEATAEYEEDHPLTISAPNATRRRPWKGTPGSMPSLRPRNDLKKSANNTSAVQNGGDGRRGPRRILQQQDTDSDEELDPSNRSEAFWNGLKDGNLSYFDLSNAQLDILNQVETKNSAWRGRHATSKRTRNERIDKVCPLDCHNITHNDLFSSWNINEVSRVMDYRPRECTGIP